MRVLITGAAGGVGQLLAPELAPGHQLRLTDVRLPPGGAVADEVVVGDLTEPGLAERLCDGVDALVHLAGNPRPGDGWDRLRGPNVDVLTAVLEAAVLAGVRRVVLASSVHAMGGYHPLARRPEAVPVRDDWLPHPCCRYGATKVFAEAAARVYADSGAMSVVCLRLGGVRPAPAHRGWLDTWLGTADLGQAVRRALSAEIGFGAYSITSANTRGMCDLGAARRELGYAPTENSETYAESVPDGPPTMCAARLSTGERR
ncbi:NAD(P)-dependent oxidoreductase [Micromonospora sp. NPDC005171]|uniref:NAD-dependent epimerase/dehydratase family protein n=1 Tax=Micromonospora sp. NPDC005171 TaxID=3156866 RepID=UPI0033AC2174